MFSAMFDEKLKELLEKDCDMYIKASTADITSLLKNSIGWKFIGELPLNYYIRFLGCYTIETGEVMWLKKFDINIISLDDRLLVFVDPTCPEVYELDNYEEITTRLLDVFKTASEVNMGDLLLSLGNQGTTAGSLSHNYRWSYNPLVYGGPTSYGDYFEMPRLDSTATELPKSLNLTFKLDYTEDV